MGIKPLAIIGIVGAGTMGSGIALVALNAGCEVYLQDALPHMLDKAEDYIKTFLGKRGQSERFSKLHLVSKLEELAPARVVIEAVPEQLALKQDLFRKLDSICPPPAILATNTSTLSVTALAAATKQPERVAGMHFFNPAPVLPLVEVVRAAQTSQPTLDALVELTQALGKTAVVTGDTPGFIVNRVARPFYGEAMRLLGEGVADHPTIDRIVEQGGDFRMGPFRLMDLIGIDVNAAAMRSMYEQTYGEPRYRPHWIQMQKAAEGALGRKTGRGFYEYKGEGGATKADLKEELKAGGGSGRVLISEGTWAPGLAELCQQAGYEIDSVPDPDAAPAACIVAAGRQEEAARLIAWYDQSLPPEVPLLIQCADISLSEAAAWVQHPERLVGFDGLFFVEGSAATLVDSGRLETGVKMGVEASIGHLGKQPIWIQDSPALVLPRIVCQLTNEAAFAELEGVADGATIDLAMRLGVNYPKGPLEWGRAIGFGKVLVVLDHLFDEYREERYKACVLLRQWARQANWASTKSNRP
ncbi:MAG: 3-hydroxyacyl-CoA dehydrogenase NAD-binding domain-containing protein [Anaerolineales bacterium]